MTNNSEANEVNPILALRHGPVLRTAAAITLIAFASLYLQPVALAAHVANKQMFGLQHKPRASAEHELAATVDQIQARLKSMHTRLGRHESISKDRDDLNTLRADLDQQNKAALAQFAAIGKRLREKHLPAVILQRQAAMVKKYKRHMRTLRANLEAIHKARNDSERLALTQKAWQGLKAVNKKRPWPKFDPNNLPNKSLKPNLKNKPRLHRKDFLRAGLTSNPRVQLAALGDFTYDKLPDASNPAYLAATPEVTLTPAIKAKAQALNYNPVKIYNWVRNNVQWIPTWGATQDADMTLGSLRGNAMDISSLLIALYRASGIPARYVHGTIQLPANKFMNWAGGFTSITAAMDYVSSGGIPITGIINGGQITQVQMEHIWVEAAIDFHPSRGAVNKSADTWVQLDPSYKQYKYLKGLDVSSISGLDPNTVASSFVSSGTVNTTEGWAQNMDPTSAENATSQAQTAVANYIQNNLTSPKLSDIIGGTQIVARDATVLPTDLPYQSLVIGARYGALPTALENRLTLGLGTDSSGTPLAPITLPWAELNNHVVTLSFKAATAADEQALASLIPAGITDPSQLPSTIPAYLINVIPVLIVDGKVVDQGNVMGLGQMLNLYYGVQNAGGRSNQTYTHQIVAGSYDNVMVGGGSVSANAVQRLQAQIAQTQATLASGGSGTVGSLTQEEMFGFLYQAGTLGYLSEYMASSSLYARRQNVRSATPTIYGTVGYTPKVDYVFGIPDTLSEGGVYVDVRMQSMLQPKGGSGSGVSAARWELGMMGSSLESSVLKQLFYVSDSTLQAVSTAKALQIAAAQGQRIYKITAANEATALPNIHFDPSVMSNIEQAVNSGDFVITHTDPISIPGWTGEGYVVVDPATGNAAYMIPGGLNGGEATESPIDWVGLVGSTSGGLHAALSEVDPILLDIEDSPVMKALETTAQVCSIVKLLMGIFKIANECAHTQAAQAYAEVFVLVYANVMITAAVLEKSDPLLAFVYEQSVGDPMKEQFLDEMLSSGNCTAALGELEERTLFA